MRGFIANILMATAILFTIPSWGQAQKEPVLDLSIPQNYRIGGITVLGAEYTDVQAVKLFSALQIGANITIPGDDIGRALPISSPGIVMFAPICNALNSFTA